MQFTVNDQEAQAYLKKKIKQVQKIKGGEQPFVKVLSAVVFADIMSHFKTESGPGGPWVAWSQIYSEHMHLIGKGGNNLLQDTGRLRGSFFPTNTRVSSQGILWFNPAKTKSGFPYAAAHQEGGPKLPARPFMWLSEEAKDNISKQTLRFLEDES